MSATAPSLVVDHPVRTGGDHPVTQHFRAAAGDRDAVEFPTYRLDTVGVPSWWTVASHDAGVSAGHGYGGTDADARRSSWGEAAEIGLEQAEKGRSAEPAMSGKDRLAALKGGGSAGV